MTRLISQRPVKRRFQWFNGLTVAVEFEIGDERFGTPMMVEYGFIEDRYDRPGPWMDKEYDFEPVDVYIGPDTQSPHVYRLTQMINGRSDEDKIMIGFQSKGEATAAYLAQLPKELQSMFGGIWSINVDDILSMPQTPKAAFESVPQGSKCLALESAADGLPKLIRFEVPITDGALRSRQGRKWDLDSIEAGLNRSNKIVSEGVQIKIFESHPAVTINTETDDEEISEVTNPVLMEYRNGFVDRHAGKVFIDAAPIGTERAILYSKLIKEGYEPKISIRASMRCTEKGGKGTCRVPENEFVAFDVLKPREIEGVEGSKLSMILESIKALPIEKSHSIKTIDSGHKHCPCGGNSKAACQECQSKKQSEKTIGTEGVKSMDEKTLQALVNAAMKYGATLEQLLADVREAGGDDAAVGKAADMFSKGSTKKTDTEGMGGEKKKEEGGDGEGMMTGFESIRKLPPALQQKIATKLVNDVTREENLTALQSSVTRARLAKAAWPLPEDRASLGFESVHDLSNLETFPLVKVTAAIEAAVAKRASLEGAATWLDRELVVIGTESAKTKEDKEKEETEEGGETKKGTEAIKSPVPKKETNKEDLDLANKIVGTEAIVVGKGTYFEAGESRRWRGSMEKMLKGLEKSAPPRMKENIRKFKAFAKAATEQALDLAEKAYGVNRLNKIHDINDNGKVKKGRESLEVMGLGDYLNREFVALAIKILTYWTSAVSELTSPTIEQAFTVGRTMNIGKIPFCQFLDVKSRQRSQERYWDPRVRQRPNEAMPTVEVDDRYDQYPGYYSSKAIYGSNELDLFMRAAPLFENIPEEKIFELTQEKALEWTQKVACELMLSWMRYKPHIVLNETVADHNNVRKFDENGNITFKNVKFGPDVILVILPVKNLDTTTAKLGPLVMPESVAFNDRGALSLDEAYPIEIDPIDGVAQVPGKLDKDNNIVPLSNRAEHKNPTYAPHPSGLIAFNRKSKVTAAKITAGNVRIGQYGYSLNYIELDFTNGTNLPRREHANTMIDKIQDGVSDTYESRECQRANVVWLNERCMNYLTVADYINGSQQSISFAKIDSEIQNDGAHAGFKYRQQQYLSSNDPLLRSGHLGMATCKGFTVATKLGSPRIVGPVQITVSDENGVSQITAQQGHYLEEVDFINTMPTVLPDGTFGEYTPFGIFVATPPPSSGLPS